MSFSTGKPLVVFCFSVFLLFLFSTSSLAALVLEPRVGFHGLFQLGRPFPLEVELANSGRPVEGDLEVRVWKGGPTKGGEPYPLHYRKNLFLSAQSRKIVRFTVDPDFISRPLTITLTTAGGRLSQEIDLRRHFSSSPLMLLVSESHAAPAIPLAAASTQRLIFLSLAELPSDSRALLGVSTLILYEQSLRDLSAAQALALESWLVAGGKMLILGSLNYALYQEPTLGRFLPVRVTGVKKFSSLPGLQRRYDEPAPATGDVWTQASRAVAGTVLLEEQGTPILVEKIWGKGKVVYLAVDAGRPPLSRWPGLPLLLKDLLGSPAISKPAVRAPWDETVFSQLLLNPSFVSTYVPTLSLFFAIVVYLGGIGLFAWLWRGPRWPRRTLLLGLVAFAVFCAFAGHLYFSRGGNIPDGILFASTLLESVPDGYVEAQSNVALFSTQIRPYRLQVDRGWIDWVPVRTRSEQRDGLAVTVLEEGGASRFVFPLREWDYKLFKLRFMDRFPVYTEIEQRGDEILLKVDNRSAKDLTDCWLVISGRGFFLGDVPRGSRWTREFPMVGKNASPERGGGDGIGLREVSFKDKTRDILFRNSFFPHDARQAPWTGGAAVFFGWVEAPERRVWVEDGRIRAYDYALFRAIASLDEEADL